MPALETLTTKQLGNIMGMTPNAIRIHLHRDPSRLPKGFRIGKAWRWNKSAVIKWIEGQS